MKLRLNKKVHRSWLISFLSFGILVGIVASPVVNDASFADLFWLITATLIFTTIAIKPVRFFVVFALIAGLMIGLWRGTSQNISLGEYQSYTGNRVVVVGSVSEDAAYGPNGEQRLRLSRLNVDGEDLGGVIWVSVQGLHDIKRGDKVIVEGLLSDGFGNFSGTIFRGTVIGIERPIPGDMGRRLRDRFAQGIYRAMPESEAKLGLGFLVGQKSTLPSDFEEQLRLVGLTHVVVASGYNLTILVRFARRGLSKISKYEALLASSILIVGFILVTGFSPSMSRAGLVAGLSLIAWYYGRVIHPIVLLPFAAAVTAIFNPSYLWGDVGWYLSFTAFAGVIILAPLLNDYFWGSQKQPGLIRQIWMDTTAAQVLTAPIIILIFQQYSVYALPANLLVLPFVPFAMLLTFVAGIFGSLFPAIAEIGGLPATLLIKYMIIVIEWLADLPGAKGELQASSWFMIVSYFLLVTALLLLKIKTNYNFKQESAL